MEARRMSTGYLSGLLPVLEESFARTAKEADYLRNPTQWAWDMLGIKLWSKQAEVAQDIATGPKKSVAVKAGHGVGKSKLASILVCWWISVHPIEQVFVASTAPSADQVSGILWREIRAAWSLSHKRFKEGLIPAPLPGYITGDNKWKDDMGNLIGQGRKPPDFNESAFQGIHAAFVLAVGDEACGLNTNMIDSLSNITSNVGSRRFLIANPTAPRSRFGDIYLDTTVREVDGKKQTLQDAWSLHSISVLDSPNFHGGEVCDCPEHRDEPHGLGMNREAMAALTDQSYVDEKKLEYGEDSARYKARVLGQFAYDEGNNLFTDFEMGKARDAIGFIDYESAATKVVLGVDVARSAHGDTSYVYSYTTALMHKLDDEDGHSLGVSSMEGGVLRKVDQYRGVPLVDRYEKDGSFTIGQATLIHQHAIELGAVEVRVDSGGLGVGLVDGLWAKWGENQKYRIVEMQGGGPTPDGRSWINNRAYQFDFMAKKFGNGQIDVDPADKVLIGQLEDILIEFVAPMGAMKIESKESMKKRGVKSPDAADAAWYACANLDYLDGLKAGDTVTKTPEQILREMVLSGFYDAYPM